MLLVLVSVLFIAFRHWAGVVFPLMVVGVTVVWMLGLASMHGMELTILTSFVPVVLMALGSADAIHLLKAYFEHRRAGGTPAEASRGVYRQMGVPIVLTTITTGIGFSSLVFTKFSIIKQFGMLAASGVIIALIVTLTLLPALLSFGITVKPAPQRTRSRKPLMDRFGGMVYRSKFVPVIAGVLVVIVSALSVPRIVKDVDWSLCLKKGSGPFHAEMLLREKFGGSLPIQVLVQGDLKDPAVLNLLRAVERRLEVTPTVHKSLSVAAVIAEMNDAMNDRYAIPQNRQGVANLWILTEGEEEIQMIVADGQQEALINAKLGTWETEPLVKAVGSVDAYLSGLPEKLTVVDLSQAPPAARIEILKLKGQQIAQELSWDLQKYGLNLGNDDLLRVVEAASTVRADSQLRDRVRLAVEAYLRSPEAEVVLAEADIQPVAVSIAENLEESLAPDASQITESLYMADRAMHPEDASFLAESLQRVVEASIGEARIAFAMQRLQEMMPGLLTKGQNLLRDIRGTLWQVNEGLAYVDSTVAADLLSENSAAVLRDVDLKLSQTGLAPVLKRMEQELIPTQVASLMITLVFVIILLSFIFRTAIGGLLAVIPIILTVLVNFSVMVYLDIGLDSFTAMIASIAIGLGIDYAIHFLSRLRDELRVDGNELAALKRTANTTGVAIIVNGLAVGLGFAVLLFAGGQHLRRFGGLTSLTMVVSGLFTLTVLPSLFLLLKPAFIKRAIAQGMESERAGTIESALKPPVQTEVLQRG
jgi:predicted RND superfamily exporter protein